MKMLFAKIFLNFFKSRFMFVGASVIIKDSKGNILLGKRSDNNFAYPSYWGLPGGLVDAGEFLGEAAKREIMEELGVKIKIIRRSNNIYESPSKSKKKIQAVGIVFYAKIIEGIPEPKDETSEVRWFKPSELKKMDLAYNHKEILKEEGVI